MPIATPVFDGAKEMDVNDALKRAGFDESGQSDLFDNVFKQFPVFRFLDGVEFGPNQFDAKLFQHVPYDLDILAI